MRQANGHNRPSTAATAQEAVPADEDIIKFEERVEDPPVPEPRVCPAFSDKSASVIFKSSDGVTLMIIICGHPYEALERCKTWETAKRLYGLMQKYQLDRLQPWFSKMAGLYAGGAPFEALCMACNNHCFDEDLARCAILYGLGRLSAANLFDSRYHDSRYKDEDSSEQKQFLLCPSNARTSLHVDLGFKGSVAYCKAFSELACTDEDDDAFDWEETARKFIRAARAFDKHKGISVRVSGTGDLITR